MNRGAFIQSEKDTRPADETREVGGFLPLALSGYNRSPDGYGVPGIVQSLIDALTAPSRAYQGKIPEEKMPHEAFNFAGGVMSGGFPLAKAGTLGMAGGKLPSAPKARQLDDLGYYLKSMEIAPTLPSKAPGEQMLGTLRNAGVKEAEIEAMKLRDLLQAKPSITRDEIVKHLEENRVGLREVTYSGDKMDVIRRRSELESEKERLLKQPLSNLRNRSRLTEITDQLANLDQKAGKVAKWSSNSLDPSNPTYGETVLHLPTNEAAINAEIKSLNNRVLGDVLPSGETVQQRLDTLERQRQIARDNVFQSGHFPEPNIAGHYQHSLVDHNGRRVFNLDQIQSDWGQRLRDKGARDEAKIAQVKALHDEAKAAADRAYQDADAWIRQHISHEPSRMGYSSEDGRMLVRSDLAHLENQPRLRDDVQNWFDKLDELRRAQDLRRAELRTAEASTPGHPLVNTTDQWTNATLRHALRAAAKADADYIAIPSGKTVLSYNPGDTHGMSEFYNKILPKNLSGLLSRMGGGNRQQIETLNTPGKGSAGQGFTLFDLPPEVRKRVLTEGQPLFLNPPAVAPLGAFIQSHED